MPIDFSRRMKGVLTQALVKSMLEDAGYRVVPLGIEEVIRELSALEVRQYLGLGLPDSLRSLPDFLVSDAAITRAWLVEVKYRRRWNAAAIEALRDVLVRQGATWGPYYLLLFLGEHAGDIDTPANRCGVFPLRVHNGELQYKSRYAPHDWFPWANAEWQFATPPSGVFEQLAARLEEQTIRRCCEFAATYPGIFEEA